jgi:hypothetical protein
MMASAPEAHTKRHDVPTQPAIIGAGSTHHTQCIPLLPPHTNFAIVTLFSQRSSATFILHVRPHPHVSTAHTHPVVGLQSTHRCHMQGMGKKQGSAWPGVLHKGMLRDCMQLQRTITAKAWIPALCDTADAVPCTACCVIACSHSKKAPPLQHGMLHDCMRPQRKHHTVCSAFGLRSHRCWLRRPLQ